MEKMAICQSKIFLPPHRKIWKTVHKRSHRHLPVLCKGSWLRNDISTSMYSNVTRKSDRKHYEKDKTIPILCYNIPWRNHLLSSQRHDHISTQIRLLPIKNKYQKLSGRQFFVSSDSPEPPNKGAILTIDQIIKTVISSSADAKQGALCITIKAAIQLQHAIK